MSEFRRERQIDYINRSAVESKLPKLKLARKPDMTGVNNSAFNFAGEFRQRGLRRASNEREGGSTGIRTGGFQKISTTTMA